MKQTYFREPKYSKNYLIQNPQNLYEQYVNAFAFSEMVKSQNLIPNKRELQQQAQSSWREIKTKSKNIIQDLIFELLQTPIHPSFNFLSKNKPVNKPSTPPSSPLSPPSPLITSFEHPNNTQIPPNAAAQKHSFVTLQKAKTDLYEYNKLFQVATTSELRSRFNSKIKKLEGTIGVEEKRLKQLKNNAVSKQRSRKRKNELLEKENTVEVYDAPGRPSFFMNDPELLEKMHNSIEFGAADYKRRKEVIKVRTVRHLREKMEENYNIYMANSTLKNYMQPRHPETSEARRHHHPAQIRLAAVGRNEMNNHIDEHYCLASVKGAKSLALAFPQDVVLISQDDKAKVPLGIAAVGRTFKAIQTANEQVSVPDHDFPVGAKHKLIPSVYLMIDSNDTNNNLRSGQMRIFIRPELFIGTSCETHMLDLASIINEETYHEFTHCEGSVKPFWCLLTDGGPDENPRFLANISKYLLFFKKFDLDYLTVRTHAPGQSAYNPVERSMASLSSKLAGIVLNAFNYGNHIGNVNGEVTVIDEELGRKNFKHAGEHLCELWNRDPINGRPVVTTYVEEHDQAVFSDINEETWDWIDRHSQICKYSVDFRKCEDRNCCKPPRAPDIYELLSLSNGFLPPIVQGQDKHFLNLLHSLEYFSNKLPGYDEHCPSISPEMYRELVCQKCGKYFPTKTFIKKHTKTMHPSRRERIAQSIGTECNRQFIEDKNDGNEVGNINNIVEKPMNHTEKEQNNNGRRIRDSSKREKGGIKNSQPWEQDHLTFQVNLREV